MKPMHILAAGERHVSLSPSALVGDCFCFLVLWNLQSELGCMYVCMTGLGLIRS